MDQNIKTRCHPSCRTCTRECLLLQKLNVNGMALAELRESCNDFLTPFYCTACDLCAVVCNRKLDPGAEMRAWRKQAAQSDGYPPAMLELRLTDNPETIYTAYRRRYGADFSFPETHASETVFFPGCALSTYTPELALSTFDYLTRRFPGIGWLDGCCYDLLDVLGLDERYESSRQSLTATLTSRGVRTIITACPTCHHRLKRSFPELQVVSIYTILADGQHQLSDLPDHLAIHDSCADRWSQELGWAVRTLLPQTEKLPHEGKRSLCCGAGGGVDFTDPELSAEIAGRHWAEVEKAGAQLLITYCTRCTVQLSQTSPGITVAHILDLIFGVHPDYAQIAARISSLCRAP